MPETAAVSPRRVSERVVTHIRPSRGWFDLQLDEAWRYRGLLATLVQRDIQVLISKPFLGAAWAILQPALAVIIFTVVFAIDESADAGRNSLLRSSRSRQCCRGTISRKGCVAAQRPRQRRRYHPQRSIFREC